LSPNENRRGSMTFEEVPAHSAPAERHVEASVGGELVCLDCFYVGRLEGVGKVWQITACDGASSYGAARVFVPGGWPRAQ
jgi:hypothetical protein